MSSPSRSRRRKRSGVVFSGAGVWCQSAADAAESVGLQRGCAPPQATSFRQKATDRSSRRDYATRPHAASATSRGATPQCAERSARNYQYVDREELRFAARRWRATHPFRDRRAELLVHEALERLPRLPDVVDVVAAVTLACAVDDQPFGRLVIPHGCGVSIHLLGHVVVDLLRELRRRGQDPYCHLDLLLGLRTRDSRRLRSAHAETRATEPGLLEVLGRKDRSRTSARRSRGGGPSRCSRAVYPMNL